MSWLDLGEYDPECWMWVPDEFPVGELDDVRDWAAMMAQACWNDSDLVPRENDVAELTDVLVACAEKYPTLYPSYRLYLHLRDPRDVPLALFTGAMDIEGDRDTELRALTWADDENVVEPPIVEEFSTPHLGTGLRVLRYAKDPEDDSIIAGLRYAWRVEEEGVDVLLFTACPDLGRLLKAVDDIDALARIARMSPEDDGDEDMG